MYRGEHEVADGHLRHAISLRNRKDRRASDYPYASYDWAGLALNKSMQGRHREAEDVLQSAPAFSDIQGDPLSVLSEVIPRTLARVRLDAGDVRGARQVFPTKEPAREDGRENLEVYYQTRGEIRCASGDHAAGLTDLTRSIHSQSAVTSPNHPWVARARAVAGLCALALGNRKDAETFASEARRAFVAQPERQPLFQGAAQTTREAARYEVDLSMHLAAHRRSEVRLRKIVAVERPRRGSMALRFESKRDK